MRKKTKKTVVIKQPEGDRAPFLRGILVQSLVRANLSFDDAYAMAQEIRDSLRNTEEISSRALKAKIAKRLEKRFGKDYRLAYESKPVQNQEIIVNTNSQHSPFSEGLLSHCLEACALPHDIALMGARKVHETLKATGHRQIGHRALRRIIYECLREHGDEEGAKRYLSWRQFQNSSQPLIILIGGASGVGKSTITSEIAYRLGIGRTQSTDMMREIIRCYLAPHVVPTLGYSSFEAWRGLPAPKHIGRRRADNPVIAGFLSQFGNVKLAVEATINRAINENQDLIVDGIHSLPWELDLDEFRKRAIVVPIMLAVMRKKLLAKQLASRVREQVIREPSCHLKNIDDIWELQ
ncbi:MAG: hypothetical protein ABFS45_08265, partial [Pseudomonadota bacterium]